MTAPAPPGRQRGPAPASTLLFGHPKGLAVIFVAEMWERFSYYGMRALLVLFMIDGLHFSNHRAGTIFGLYTGSAYLTGVLAGALSDRYLGRGRAMVFGGCLMVLGHFAMVVPGTRVFFAALTLIAVGTGFFKPNSASMVGSLYDPLDPRRERAYAAYYFGINLGSFLAVIICGYLGQNIGWHWGFCAAGVGMTLGLGIFVLGRRHIGGLGPPPARARLRRRRGPAPRLSAVEKQKMLAVMLLGLVGNVAFWSTFDQAGSSLNIFAQQSCQLVLPGIGWAMPASWLQATNPIFILLLTPIFALMWQHARRRGKEPATVTKFVMGLGLVAAGFGVMMWAGHLADRQGLVAVGWLVLVYLLHTLGELMIAPVGLAVVSRLSPPRHASMMMSLWFATWALAEVVGGRLAAAYTGDDKARFFAVPTSIALTASVLLWVLSRPIRRLMHDVL